MYCMDTLGSTTTKILLMFNSIKNLLDIGPDIKRRRLAVTNILYGLYQWSMRLREIPLHFRPSPLLSRISKLFAIDDYRSIMKTNGTVPVIENETIDPTDKEKHIFNQLLQVLVHFNLKTQLRVAGGWVRDKLLGKECYDIDISLDNMLGREFCEKVNEYLVSTGEKAQEICVIHSNPDQSKHLETARMRLFGVSIDFVNLRSEECNETTMKFGSPKQDVYLRDLTINTLFYNIHTCSIEDFTGKGLDDLKNGKIVTPLPPKVTFLDDALRVLRAIRFSTRFDFEISEEIKIAALDNDVKSAFWGKISRGRIGNEIDIMITGNQPNKAMNYIYDLGLFSVVFKPPENCKPLILKEHEKICVGYMDLAWRQLIEVGCSFTDKQRRLYLYASLFLPFRKRVYVDNKKKTEPVVNYIFKKSLILNAGYGVDVMRLYNGIEKFLCLIPFILSGADMSKVKWGIDFIHVPVKLKLRILLGLFLREMKDLWRVALMMSSMLWEEVEKRREVFKKVEREIVTLGLERVWEVKRLVDGNDIIRHLKLERGGPFVKKYKRNLPQWQLAYPSGSVDEFFDWMRLEMSKSIDQTGLDRSRTGPDRFQCIRSSSRFL